MYNGELRYVQGFLNDCSSGVGRNIIEDSTYGEAIEYGYSKDVTQSEVEDFLLKYFKPKFSNPEIHIMGTELYYDPIGFIGYSWPLEVVAEKLQERDMRFFTVGFDEDY